MEANMDTKKVGGEKPSLLGIIISPGLQFERMKMSEKVWGMFFLVALLQGLVGAFGTYVMNTSPEGIKMKKELGGLVGQGSLTLEIIYGAISGFVEAMIGALFVAGIYKVFIMLFGNDTSYKTLLTIIVYTNIVLIIGGLINTILNLIFGGGATEYTSLGPLFTEGSFAYEIGTTVEVFYVWNLVLIWLGLQITAGLSKVKAAIPIMILFIIFAIIILITNILQGMFS
ncbi:Yip1 family protein [Bacillus cereus]|uniref:Yip1 family protein n=1 Tax=Bacillus cereus TaxID=1396 RepID=UPI0011A94722|nr:Yip1 family protein [Bacillus cereus]